MTDTTVNSTTQRPEVGKIGVGVAAIINNGKGQILLGKRKGSHGSGKEGCLPIESAMHDVANISCVSIYLLTALLPLGTWQLPGGHLEYQEELFACAEREAKEETGLDIKAVRIETLTNDVFRSDHKHYITIFAQCEMVDPQAQPQVRNLVSNGLKI